MPAGRIGPHVPMSCGLERMTAWNSPRWKLKDLVVRQYAKAAWPKALWRLLFQLVAHKDIQQARDRHAACDHGDWRQEENDRVCGKCGMVMEDWDG